MNSSFYKEKGLKLEYIYLISLILLSLYGIYKNTLTYIIFNQLSINIIIKPLLLIFLPVLIIGIIDFLKEKKLTFKPLLAFMCSISMPYMTNFLLVPILMLIYYFFLSKLSFSIHPVLLIHVLIMVIFKYNYLNLFEKEYPMFYGIIDTLLGKSIGGIGITNLLLIIITGIIFLNRFYYKKEIPILSILTYSILSIVVDLICLNSNLFLNLLNSSVYYISIYLLPLNKYSPLKKKWQLIYALLCGLFMYLFTYYSFIEGPFIGALLINIIFNIGKLLSKKND